MGYAHADDGQTKNTKHKGEIMSHCISTNIGQFVIAGKALFTVVNETTGNRFTFKVVKAETTYGQSGNIWFVKVLDGPDNYSNYRYIGMIALDGSFVHTRKSTVSETAPSFKAFSWFWRNVDRLPENVKVYHEGKCGRCGRRLTVPESIESGYGPECINHVFG
jgi:hypothetical protein